MFLGGSAQIITILHRGGLPNLLQHYIGGRGLSGVLLGTPNLYYVIYRQPLSGFFPLGKGYPPILLSYFGQNDFPLEGGGRRYPLSGKSPVSSILQLPLWFNIIMLVSWMFCSVSNLNLFCTHIPPQMKDCSRMKQDLICRTFQDKYQNCD